MNTKIPPVRFKHAGRPTHIAPTLKRGRAKHEHKNGIEPLTAVRTRRAGRGPAGLPPVDDRQQHIAALVANFDDCWESGASPTTENGPVPEQGPAQERNAAEPAGYFENWAAQTVPGPAQSAPASGSRNTSAPAGFLWKPTSESDGNLVILLPKEMAGRVRSVRVRTSDGQTAEGRATGVANGGRPHFRFDRPGSTFPPNSQVEIEMTDGSRQSITIEQPAQRVEGGR